MHALYTEVHVLSLHYTYRYGVTIVFTATPQLPGKLASCLTVKNYIHVNLSLCPLCTQDPDNVNAYVVHRGGHNLQLLTCSIFLVL